MTKLKKTLAIILVGITCTGVTMYGATKAKADTKPVYSAETMKSENKDIKYHWCEYVADCDDNCVENGFSIYTKDQDGEAYVFTKDYSDQDYKGTKFLVVTKYDNKNVISAYQITDKGLKDLYTDFSPSHIGGAQ